VRRIVRVLAVTVLVLMLIPPITVLAIADPDVGPTIENVDIYRHCLEEDDLLILAQYYVDYTVLPTETISQSFIGRFMDGAVELTNVEPYAYNRKGYGHGAFSMYLSADEVTALGITWEGVYTIRFSGNPTLAWPGVPPSVSATTFTWHSTTTLRATELLLSSKVITIANSLSGYWSVALTVDTHSGVKLSSSGEQYFVNTIPNLRVMTPGVFPAGIEAPEYEEEDYTQSYRDTLLGRWDGTMAGRALNNFATWTTLPLTVAKGLIWLVITGLVMYFMALAAKDLRLALFLGLLMMPLGNVIGMLSLTFTIVCALGCVLALGYALFYQRAAG